MMSVIKLLPFLVLGILFLFGGHYLIYRSLAGVFNIVNPVLRSGLLAFLLLMPLGFFAVSVLAHFSQTALTRFLYVIASVWLGLAISLLLAAGVIWGVEKISSLAGITIDRPLFGAAIFLLAIIFSAGGSWAAFHPKIKNLEVALKGLPANWQGKTVVQLSDVHLGHIHRLSFIKGIVEQVNARQPDLVLITGDLFDGMDGDLGIFARELDKLEAKDGIFFTTGNHETYVGLERALAALAKTKIRVLRNEMVEIGGLQIIGLDYSEASSVSGRLDNETNIINSLAGFDKNKTSILMYHAPTNIEQAKASGISLQLSGHTHDGQIWPLNFFTWLIYGRYDYGLRSEGDFSIYTTNGVGTWGPPMRTSQWPEIPVFELKQK